MVGNYCTVHGSGNGSILTADFKKNLIILWYKITDCDLPKKLFTDYFITRAKVFLQNDATLVHVI